MTGLGAAKGLEPVTRLPGKGVKPELVLVPPRRRQHFVFVGRTHEPPSNLHVIMGRFLLFDDRARPTDDRRAAAIKGT
jgi:hypothetical protein